MKKRIACFLLTLIMLVSLVPVGAVTASAASLSTSEAAITVLKKMTPFKSTCYQVANTQEFRIGYGTICNEKHYIGADGNPISGTKEEDLAPHKIGQADADKALRAALKELDQKVSSFASSNGLTLKQNQHDALVIFSYNSGTGWMDGNGVVKTAIVNGASATELLNAMNQWTNNADLDRRKIEVNMYMNGIYSNVAPSSYSWVIYDANGGSMAQGAEYTMYYDTTTAMSHIPAPTKNGSTFLGWYARTSSGMEWVPTLTGVYAKHTLYALWQDYGLEPENAIAGSNIKYTLAKSKLASSTVYNMPDVKDGKKIGKVSTSTVTVMGDYIGSDGTRWARVSDGWVIVTVGKNGAPASGAYIDVTVTVTNSYVNMRKNATIYSATNGRWNQGDQLRIINTESADGFVWGQVAKSEDDDTPVGWVALVYTNWNAVKDGASSGSTNSGTAIARATVTYNGYVNVRSDAGTNNKIVGALGKNETVDVYEIKTVNGHQWGRTDSGWFCLTYASVTMLATNSSNNNNLISDAGALDYSFTGKLQAAVRPHVQAGENTNYAADAALSAGTSVTLTNMVVTDGETWGKIIWRVDTDDDGELDTNKTGWIVVDSPLTTSGGKYINIDAARFQVVSDVKVRTEPDNAADATFTMTKGIEFEAETIQLVGENIWGKTAENNNVLADENYNGWVNLSSKYVKRVNAPTIEGDKSNPITGKVATVVNTDSVRVRNYGSTTSGKVIGSLSRGSTVAVWEVNEDTNWYKIDTNQNGVYDYDGDGWVYGQYLQISDSASSGDSSSDSTSSGSTGTRVTGTGIVANTYAGVNVRTGAGVGNAFVCKLLPGTQVEILEVTTVGASKWGRIDKGWVCMDYIAMISYDEIPGNTTGTGTTSGNNGTAVDSLDKVDKTTTTAVYTGKTAASVNVYATPALASEGLENAEVVRVLNAGDPITMYELVAVTETYEEQDSDEKINETEEADKQGGGTTTTVTVTSYWARVNGGYIYNPEDNISLDALDEQVHTLTGSDSLNVRAQANTSSDILDKLEKGDQVSVTKLQIENDKVWGYIETENDGYGWVRLDYMSEGAYYVNEPADNTANTTTNTPAAPVMGSTGNTGTAGIANNTSGYKYTGKVINTETLNVRQTASTTAKKTTELKRGASLVIYETTISENMAWGRCDAGWVYLYYVDLTPSGGSAIDARVVYNDNTIIYTDTNCSEVAGTYSRMSVIDVYEIVGSMVRTDLGWVNTSDLLS